MAAEHAVLVVGPVPPPVHGAARVTGLVLDTVRRAGGRVRAIDTSGRDDAGPLRYHLTRLGAHARAVLAAVRPRRGRLSVYVGGAGGLGLWYQLPVVAAARLGGHRTVFHHHSYAYLTRRSVVMRAIVRAGGPRLLHVTLGEPMSRRLGELYPGASTRTVCSNAGLMAAAESPRAAGAGPLVLGHLGNLSVHKGLDVVLETVRRLRADGVAVRLLLAGPVDAGEPSRLVDAARVEFGGDLECLGPIRPDDVPAFHARLDAFLFPSRYRHEAEPLVVLEASRCGVPTLAFDVGCVGPLVADPRWRVAPDADYPAAVAAALPGLRDPATRAQVLDHFAGLRASALEAHRDLVDVLTGTRPLPSAAG